MLLLPHLVGEILVVILLAVATLLVPEVVVLLYLLLLYPEVVGMHLLVEMELDIVFRELHLIMLAAAAHTDMQLLVLVDKVVVEQVELQIQ